MTISRVPLWNIAVYTIPDRSAYSGLRNALLYGDHVHWISLDPIIGIATYITEAIRKNPAGWGSISVRG